MSQINYGIRKVLNLSYLYDIFQYIIGTNRARRIFVNDYLPNVNQNRILDIGCGTGNILNYLPQNSHYVGFDESENYIINARKRFGSKGEFFQSSVNNVLLDKYDNFDCIIATFLLHHLTNDEVINLLKVVKKKLSTSGKFISIDPCFIHNQSFISKLLISYDRGQNVKTINEYKSIINKVFTNIDLYHRNDLLRIPYDHAVIISS